MLFLTVFGGSEEIIALYYAISLRMVVLNYGEVEEWSVYVCGRFGCVCVDG